MTALSPGQRRWRERIETGLRLAEPALNFVLVAGERLSRVVQRQEDDYYPPQRASLPPTVGGAESVEEAASDER